MEDKFDYTEDELQKLGDAILWTAILAAIHQDGVIQPEERAEAIKQTHIRTFSTADYLRPIYEHLDNHFEKDFDAYGKLLPETYEAKEAFIKEKLAVSMTKLNEMGPVFSAMFSKDLKSFYHRIFNAGSTIFQLFAFPLLSAHLQKTIKEAESQ